MVGTVGKFMSATHMGMASNPSLGASGVKPGIVPRASTAVAEIARQLGVSTPTVYRYLNKSRED